MFDGHNWSIWALIILVGVIVSVLAALAIRGTFEIPLGETNVFKQLIDYALDHAK